MGLSFILVLGFAACCDLCQAAHLETEVMQFRCLATYTISWILWQNTTCYLQQPEASFCGC